MKRSIGLLFAGGGAAVVAVVFLANRKANAVAARTKEAVATGGKFNARITGYWPFSATAGEVKMEGGVNDRKGKPLHTLEMFQADPIAHPYVAVSGDPAIFPYGQRIAIDEWPDVVFRVVDTGSHFFGSQKVFRAAGREPLDVCVQSSATKVTPNAVATIFPGDHFDKPGKMIALGKFQGQTVVGLDGLNFLGAT